MTDDQNSPDPSPDPGYGSVLNFLLYSLSVPERALRSATSVVGGTLRESAALLVPQAFQSSKTYSIFVTQMLDFLVEDVGGVQRQGKEGQAAKVENFVARKTVGNFVELAGLATFHISPMTVLAIVSDVAYGSQVYLKELAGELKQAGVIDENSTVEKLDDFLQAVSAASGTTASAFDTPPLSVEGLLQTIEETRKAVAKVDPRSVIPESEIRQLWNDMHEIAAASGVDPLAISSAMTLYSLNKVGAVGLGALSTVRAAGNVLNRTVLNHYFGALDDIRRKGLYGSLAESSKPYLAAVWDNFSSGRTTVTEDVVSGRLLGRLWQTGSNWLFGPRKPGE
ncbi:MAG: hypothetical protein ACYC6Y_27345 [Thermoguttaceae bacterium]